MLAAVLVLMPLLSFSSGMAAAAAAPPVGSVTFYLHDDGNGYGHYGKRFDWANTSTPYNPLNPNFISPLYQGIELNASGTAQYFRWVSWPAAGGSLSMHGNVSVTLYMSEFTSSGSPDVSFLVQLQYAASMTASSGTLLAENSTALMQLSPNQGVQVTLNISGTVVIPAGSVLLLNLSRTDSNSGTSVFVSFDYNSTPSSFSANLAPRISVASIALSPSTQITDSSVISILANVSDLLGHQDVAGATVTVTGSGGILFAANSQMNLYTASQYYCGFVYTTKLPAGNYTLNITATTVSTLAGYNQSSTASSALEILPSLGSFRVQVQSRAEAGLPFMMNMTAYTDTGVVMTGFNGTALVSVYYSNTTRLSSWHLLNSEINFTSGLASEQEAISASGNFTMVASNGTATGSASLYVTAGPVAAIMVSPAVASISAGQTLQFSATGYDGYGNINSSWSPTWSASGPQGEISGSGIFTALKNGTSEITASDQATGATGSANVSISASSLFALLISPSVQSILAGQTYFFSASGYDYYGNQVPLLGVVWETNAGTLFTNGTEAMLNATPGTMNGGWIEALSGGISTVLRFNVVASSFSPQELLQIPEQTWPSGSSWVINLTSFFSNPNDPGDAQLEWFVTGGAGILYTYGSGTLGNTNVRMVPYPGMYGRTMLTLEVKNSLGYSVTETFVVNVLPRPIWLGGLPQYMTVPADTYYTINYTYFLNTTPFSPESITITTSSPYVYSSGLELTYFFPLSTMAGSYPVIITATNPDNVSSSIVQILTAGSAAAPSVNTASAPPSSLTIGRGGNVTLEYPVETYFISNSTLSFSVSAIGASASLEAGDILSISTLQGSYNSEGSVLISARSSSGEYAFLMISLKIVSVIAPPSVRQLPAVYVRYSSSGQPNYSFPLLQYVRDIYVPITEVSVLTSSVYVTFNRGNFSLMFSMPAAPDGSANYTSPYWYNTTLVVVGGPIQYLAKDSVSIPLSIHVSSVPPPGPSPGKVIPAFIVVAENSTNRALNLSNYITAPDGEAITYNATTAPNLTVSVSSGGLVTVSPRGYFRGNEMILFTADSSSGFFDFAILAMVYPVFIPPVIVLPHTITIGSSLSVVNLSKFIVNPNGDPLYIEAFGKGVSVVGNQMLVSLPPGVSSETVMLVFLTSAGSAITREISVGLAGQFPSIYVIMFYLLLIVMLAVGAALAYQHFVPKHFQLTSVLLVHNDGRLIARSHAQRLSGVDSDLLVGMFTAIQEFATTSFAEIGVERQTLNSIELGKFTLYVERGSNAFILTVYTGEPTRNWQLQVGLVLSGIEENYRLEGWDGRQDSIEGISAELDSLFPGNDRSAGS